MSVRLVQLKTSSANANNDVQHCTTVLLGLCVTVSAVTVTAASTRTTM